MNQFEQILFQNVKYAKRLISNRNNESIRNLFFYAEASPLELYNHAISTMIHFSQIDFANFETKKIESLSFNKNSPLSEQLISCLDQMLDEFSKSMARINERSNLGELSDFISLNVMHTVTHIGQALRLQKINLNIPNMEEELGND